MSPYSDSAGYSYFAFILEGGAKDTLTSVCILTQLVHGVSVKLEWKILIMRKSKGCE